MRSIIESDFHKLASLYLARGAIQAARLENTQKK